MCVECKALEESFRLSQLCFLTVSSLLAPSPDCQLHENSGESLPVIKAVHVLTIVDKDGCTAERAHMCVLSTAFMLLRKPWVVALLDIREALWINDSIDFHNHRQVWNEECKLSLLHSLPELWDPSLAMSLMENLLSSRPLVTTWLLKSFLTGLPGWGLSCPSFSSLYDFSWPNLMMSCSWSWSETFNNLNHLPYKVHII